MKETEVVLPQLVTVEQAASILAVTRQKVYRLIYSGDIPTVRVGRAQRIKATELAAYVERQSTAEEVK